MSFLKKLNRQKSVDLEEEAKKKEEKEKAKEMKRAKRHSVHVSSKREIPDNAAVEAERSKDDSCVDDKASRKKREAELKERDRRKFKDMSGIVTTSPNEYPVFIVHYLGRMPADSEYGREAVEDPVHQLCQLREKQKLPKILLAFNVDGMMCREVSGPFLKPKKEGLTFFIPLHHITYGVASLTHPQVFAIITKMMDDPSPANQVLVLHAFLCEKPKDSQALTYWQLQAYIEAFEDLKRKRMLKMRRKQALSKSFPEEQSPIPSPGGAGPSTSNGDGAHRISVPPSPAADSADSASPQISLPKVTAVKPKRTNSVTSTSSSSSSSSRKTTPGSSRRSSDGASPSSSSKRSSSKGSRSSSKTSKDSPIQGATVQSPPPSQQAGRGNQDVFSRRGPPPMLRGPPPDSGPFQLDVPPMIDRQRMGQGSATSRDSAYVEGDDEFPITFSPGPTSPPPVSSPPPPSSTASATSPSSQGSVFPGIAPRKSSESESSGRGQAFESRISELQGLVEMDAEKLKRLMIQEYPTISR